MIFYLSLKSFIVLVPENVESFELSGFPVSVNALLQHELVLGRRVRRKRRLQVTEVIDASHFDYVLKMK